MENQESNKSQPVGQEHPKPTENVQLEIETVIPDTEKEAQHTGTTDAKSKDSKPVQEKEDIDQEDKKEDKPESR